MMLMMIDDDDVDDDDDDDDDDDTQAVFPARKAFFCLSFSFLAFFCAFRLSLALSIFFSDLTSFTASAAFDDDDDDDDDAAFDDDDDDDKVAIDANDAFSTLSIF